MRLNNFTLLVLIVLTATLIAACGGGDKSNEAGSSASNDVPVGDAQVIEVTLTDFEISPASIELQQGQPVQLVVTNAGPTIHDIVIAGLGVDVRTRALETGETQTLTFTPNRSGRIETYCSIPGHKALGMVGEIKVD